MFYVLKNVLPYSWQFESENVKIRSVKFDVKCKTYENTFLDVIGSSQGHSFEI